MKLRALSSSNAPSNDLNFIEDSPLLQAIEFPNDLDVWFPKDLDVSHTIDVCMYVSHFPS